MGAESVSKSKKPVSKRRGHLGLGRSQTRIAGKFRSQYTEQRLYEVVRKAALYCKPDYPKELRQTEFDRCRAEIGHADSPTARQIAKRLDRSWPDIVSDAVDENTNQTQKDAVTKKNEEAPWLTTDHVFYALRRAARHLGQETVTADQYDVARVELIAADRKKHKFGGYVEENMPTASQIERVAREAKPGILDTDWEKACVIAMLPKPGDEEAGQTGKGSRRGLEMHIAIHHYAVASDGLLPSSRAGLEKFARDAGIAMARQPKDKTFQDLIHEANAHRKSLGLEPASEIAPAGNKGVEFDFSKLDLDGAPAAIVALSKEEKVAKFAEFLDYCDEVKAQPRQKLYKGLAPKKGWPAASKLDDEMKWADWIKAADEWRAEQAKAA